MQPAVPILTEKPRLLIILNRFVIGGQAVDTIPLAWYLKDFFDILILYGEKEKDEIEPSFLLERYKGLQLKKIKYLRRSVNPLIDVIAFFYVLYTIFKFKADIVHTHGAKSGFVGRVAAWMAGVPVIIHTFHGHFFHSYFSKTVSGFIAIIERIIGKITTSAIALSSDQKAELVEVYKVLPAQKIKIIQLGFAFDENNNDFDRSREAFKVKYGLLHNDVAIGIVGRIVPIKNHSFFVKAIQQLLSQNTVNKPAFFIIGDGDIRPQVESELRQKSISFNNKGITATNRVVLTSWVTDMYEVMTGLDIIALTSLNEGTPLSVIEAQFFKRPVVSTNAGGVKNTMQDGVTGFVVEKNDLVTFCKKLNLLIDSKEMRTAMGEEGYKFAAEKFSKQKEVSVTKDLYFTLLKQKGRLRGINNA
ncbi:MAG: glycosyltransferase family 1 protein [Segetibacter sp.]|nr:glycosyltransferase family 1 protein [Segetibacter sp.]